MERAPRQHGPRLFIAGLDAALSCAVALILKAVREEAAPTVPEAWRAGPVVASYGALPPFAHAAGVVAGRRP